jgi:predicted  nucleic acid-binding Zn-ribbon protein
MDDSVQVTCTRCRSRFRDRARRVQSGYSRQCPNCEVIIFFEESTFDKNVQTAMRAAKKLRRALREAEGKQPGTDATSPTENGRARRSGRKEASTRRAAQGRSEIPEGRNG